MKEVPFDLGRIKFQVQVPDHADVLRMGKPRIINRPEPEIYRALRSPEKCPPLQKIVRNQLRSNPLAEAVIVISDNTRPVPYSGKSGILLPVLKELIEAGIPAGRIRLLVATGTHRAMDQEELKEILDPRIFGLGLFIVNHDSRKKEDMEKIGQTQYGGDIHVNKLYLHSDIKILTGLVESHFMAGVSGGRKSICPGLISESSTYALHSGPILNSPQARDLVLEGNPVHEEALKVARMAGCDMIVNVTLDSNFDVTGVFAGDLEKAHRKAFEKLRSYAAIPVQKKYDLVVTHAGYVGVNHYQAAKGALVCARMVKEQGMCLLAAHHTDRDPIGRENYKKMLRLLGEKGSEKFIWMILDPEWTFVPEQWEAQMWTRLFERTPPENLLYCCQDIPEEDFNWIPGKDARSVAGKTKNLAQLVDRSIAWAVETLHARLNRPPEIAILPDGPYGIPV